MHRGAPLQYVYGSARTGSPGADVRSEGQTGGGKSDSELLIKSETPKGPRSENKRDRKAPRKSDRKDLIESETQDRREAPGGKPERVSTKEASVP